MSSSIRVSPARKHNSIVTMGLTVFFDDEYRSLDVLLEDILQNSSFISSFFKMTSKEEVNDNDIKSTEAILFCSEDSSKPDWTLIVNRDSINIYHNDYRRWKYTYEVCRKSLLDFQEVFRDRKVSSVFHAYYDIFYADVKKDGDDLEKDKLPALILKESDLIPNIAFENNMSSFSTEYIKGIYDESDMSIMVKELLSVCTSPNTPTDADSVRFDIAIDNQITTVIIKNQMTYAPFVGGEKSPLDLMVQMTHNLAKKTFVSTVDNKWLKMVGIEQEEAKDAERNIE